TALRMVTSKRPARREPGLIGSYPGGGLAVHRESALVQRLLASAGVELSEAMACGLGGGIGFMYAVFEYKQAPHPLLTFVTQHHPRPWAEERRSPRTSAWSSRSGPRPRPPPRWGSSTPSCRRERPRSSPSGRPACPGTRAWTRWRRTTRTTWSWLARTA